MTFKPVQKDKTPLVKPIFYLFHLRLMWWIQIASQWFVVSSSRWIRHSEDSQCLLLLHFLFQVNASNMGPSQSLFPLWGMIFLQKYEDRTPFQISCHWLSCLISVVKSSPLTRFKMVTVHYSSPTLWQSLIPLDSLCFLNPLDLPKYCVYLCSFSVGELHTEGSLPCYALFFPAPRTFLSTQ